MTLESSIIIALVALLGNAFFVGAGFGLVSARRSSIELRAANGVKRAKITLLAMEQVSLMLAGAQLGITLYQPAWCLVPLASRLWRICWNHRLPLWALLAARHIVAFTIAMILMVYLHVVIGEMVPKKYCARRSDASCTVACSTSVLYCPHHSSCYCRAQRGGQWCHSASHCNPAKRNNQQF